MCPRTSWSLSSLTLNIVLGRASVTSPSISIFSSLPIGGKRVADVTNGPGALTPLERRLSGPVGEERLDRRLKILSLEQAPRDLRRHPIGLLHPALAKGLHDA